MPNILLNQESLIEKELQHQFKLQAAKTFTMINVSVASSSIGKKEIDMRQKIKKKKKSSNGCII